MYKLASLREMMHNENIDYYLFNVGNTLESVHETMVDAYCRSETLSNKKVEHYRCQITFKRDPQLWTY